MSTDTASVDKNRFSHVEFERELVELSERVSNFHAEYERPIVVNDFKRLLTLCNQARVIERDRIVDWLSHRCQFAPPCGNCTYCAIGKTLNSPDWLRTDA